MDRPIWLLRAAILALGWLLVPALPARADPPVLLTSVSGTCDPTVGSSNFSTTPLTGTHDDLDWRVVVDGGPGAWPGFASWPAASTFWGGQTSLPDGQSQDGTIECGGAAAPFHYEIDWYEPPTSPASFSGVLAPGQTMSLDALFPDAGPYLIASSGTGGDVGLDLDPGFDRLSPDGELISGLPGLNRFDIINQGATPGSFTITIAEQIPVVETDRNPLYITTIAPLVREYGLNGPAHVLAELLGVDGATPIRTLENRADGPDVQLRWDLTDAAGAFVGDGGHLIRLTLSDSAGTFIYYDRIVIDTKPPRITINAPVFPGLLSVEASDAGSGVASATATLDGVMLPLAGPVFRPRRLVNVGVGTHTVNVVATDHVGRTASQTETFTVVPRPVPPPPKVCGPVEARRLIRSDSRAVSRLRRLARLGRRDVFSGYEITKVLCPYFTQGFLPDMVVLMKARHGQATPLAFGARNGGGWRLRYLGTKARVSSIAIRGPRLLERVRGRHGRSRIVRLGWNGHTLVVLPSH